MLRVIGNKSENDKIFVNYLQQRVFTMKNEEKDENILENTLFDRHRTFNAIAPGIRNVASNAKIRLKELDEI